MKVVIMIPTYNEKENIIKLLRELEYQVSRIKGHQFIILVVDDNSPDGTGQLVKEYKTKFKIKNLFLLSGKKEGLGMAMKRGYIYAMKTFAPDVIIANEADFAVSFKHVKQMLVKIEEGYDVVVASRHVGIGKTKGWTISRKLNHFMANTVIASWVAGVNVVYDKNMAFKAVRVKGVLDKINLREFDVRGFGFFYYFVYKLSLVTDKFDEFPVTYKFRTKGESKVSFNRKYLRTYLRDIGEYAFLAFKIRCKKLKLIDEI